MKVKRTYTIFLTVTLTFFVISCDPSGNKAKTDGNNFGFTAGSSCDEKTIDMTQFEKKELDIPYAGNNNPRQTLDIIYPSQAKAPYKTIMVFHGGGWMSGHKRSGTIASIFKSTGQGYAIVSVNYRLSDEVIWPKPLHDAKAAIRFIRSNAGKYHLDVKRIVAWGVSAGGHIAEMLGVTNNLPDFEDLSMGSKKETSTVQGIVSWYGVSDISSLTDAGKPFADKIMGFDVRKNRMKTYNASPIELVTDQHPPLLLVHGTMDEVVPYQQSVNMQKKINNVTGKQTAVLIPFIRAAHSDNVIKSNDSIAECLDFIDGILFKERNPYRSQNFITVRVK